MREIIRANDRATALPKGDPLSSVPASTERIDEARPELLERPTLPAKRALDVLLAALGLVLSACFWPLLALAVKLEDGGPVFFSQERVGKGGRLFRSWKFRSMVPLEEDDRDAPKQAELEEHRVTRTGRLMRATALDELPQLWNVLKGDMSFVGPRALVPEEREANGGGGPVRLEEHPGY